MSAQQLSEVMGGEMSRGVIANIESGRKTDVTVDQLISLSWALGIPPVVLALPVEEPYKFIKVLGGTRSGLMVTSKSAVEWFNPDRPSPPLNDQRSPGTALAHALLRALNEYMHADQNLYFAKAQLEEGKGDQARVDEAQAVFDSAAERFLSLGGDLTVYKTDD